MHIICIHMMRTIGERGNENANEITYNDDQHHRHHHHPLSLSLSIYMYIWLTKSKALKVSVECLAFFDDIDAQSHPKDTNTDDPDDASAAVLPWPSL